MTKAQQIDSIMRRFQRLRALGGETQMKVERAVRAWMREVQRDARKRARR